MAEEADVYESGTGQSNSVVMSTSANADDRRESAMAEQTDGSETVQQQAAESTDQQHRPHHNQRPTAVFVHGPPVPTVRDRVFHAMFYRLALVYAHAVPHQLRRVIEFALLFEVRYYCCS